MAITLVLIFDTAVLVICAILLFQKRKERIILRSFIKSTITVPATDRELVLQLARKVFRVPCRPDPVPWSRLFRTFGARASAVIQSGGCCAGKGRLLILLLEELNIHAYQIGLYHTNGQAQHCLIEVCLKDERLIVDPTYGIYYTAKDGGPISFRQLQNGVIPSHVPLLQHLKCGYPNNSYYDFCYTASKTLNWTKSLARKMAYPILRNITRGGIDRLAVPAFFEWPHHLLIILATVIAATVTAGVVLISPSGNT